MTGYLDGASRNMMDVASTAPSVAYDATVTHFRSLRRIWSVAALVDR
jgi:hypothetical protein